MPVAKQYMLVRIDMKMQSAKREKIGNIFLSEAILEMERYLQFGEILDIGEVGKRNFPEAQVGDIALFHHTIEDDDWRLINTDENGDEHRLVDCRGDNNNHELFGFIRGTDLMPVKEYVFISFDSVQRIKKKVTTSLLLVDDEIWDDRERLESVLEDLKTEAELMEENLSGTVFTDDFYKEEARREDIIKSINKTNEERAMLTSAMHKPKLAWCQVVAIHKDTSKELLGASAGSIVMSQLPFYPIDLFGNIQFFLCRRQNVLCILEE